MAISAVFTIRPWTGSDWMLAAMLAIFTASALLSGQPEITDGVTSKWGRLVTSFLIPALLYGIIRQLDITRRDWSRLLAALAVLGFYLACTGALEVAQRWSFVFPRYIANPNLGIHFGRARGPELNAVSLGLYITACLLCGWTLLSLAGRRLYQLALIVALPIMAGGVLFTYTRSTWIGLAASGLVVAAFLYSAPMAHAGNCRRSCRRLLLSWSRLGANCWESNAKARSKTRSIRSASVNRLPTYRGRCFAITRFSASALADSTIANCRICPIARRTSSWNRSADCTITTHF